VPDTLTRVTKVALAPLSASSTRILADASASMRDIEKAVPTEQYRILLALAVLASEIERAPTARRASPQRGVPQSLLDLLQDAQRAHPAFFRSPAVRATIRQLAIPKKTSLAAEEKTPAALRRTIVTRIVASAVPTGRPTRMLSAFNIYLKGVAEPVRLVLTPEDLAGVGLAALATLNYALETAIRVHPRMAAEFAHPGVVAALADLQPLLETLGKSLRKARRTTRVRERVGGRRKSTSI
jgi:hypothetical protein